MKRRRSLDTETLRERLRWFLAKKKAQEVAAGTSSPVVQANVLASSVSPALETADSLFGNGREEVRHD